MVFRAHLSQINKTDLWPASTSRECMTKRMPNAQTTFPTIIIISIYSFTLAKYRYNIFETHSANLYLQFKATVPTTRNPIFALRLMFSRVFS